VGLNPAQGISFLVGQGSLKTPPFCLLSLKKNYNNLRVSFFAALRISHNRNMRRVAETTRTVAVTMKLIKDQIPS
jgi:hypothetical protein